LSSFESMKYLEIEPFFVMFYGKIFSTQFQTSD
jgi:hypothetical protein